MIGVHVEIPDEVYQGIKQLRAEEAAKGNKYPICELYLYLVQQGIDQPVGQPIAYS